MSRPRGNGGDLGGGGAWRHLPSTPPAIARSGVGPGVALDAGSLLPAPLHDYAKTGDLTDCGKLVVTVEGETEQRIVVRDVGGGGFEVSEVIAVEDRTGDLPYLLAGLRLGRLEDPLRRSDAQRRVARIRQLSGR